MLGVWDVRSPADGRGEKHTSCKKICCYQILLERSKKSILHIKRNKNIKTFRFPVKLKYSTYVLLGLSSFSHS